VQKLSKMEAVLIKPLRRDQTADNGEAIVSVGGRLGIRRRANSPMTVSSKQQGEESICRHQGDGRSVENAGPAGAGPRWSWV
jgi:hypothetical protein